MPQGPPSAARRYKSRFAPGTYVTAAQWLSEELCRRQAEYEGRMLQPYFWRQKHWEGLFRRHLKRANDLFRRFDETVVGRALRSPEGKSTRTLEAPWLEELLVIEQKRYDREIARAGQGAPVDSPVAPPDEVDPESVAAEAPPSEPTLGPDAIPGVLPSCPRTPGIGPRNTIARLRGL